MKTRATSVTRLALLTLSLVASGAMPSAGAAPITGLRFGPGGAVLAAGSHDKLTIRSSADAAEQRPLPCDLARISSLAISPGGRWLAAAGGIPGVEGTVVLFDWETRAPLGRFTNHVDLVTAVEFSPDGASLAVSSADHIGRVFRIENGGRSLVEAFNLNGHAGPVLAIAFSPTGQTVLTGGADRSLKVWSAEDGRLIRSFGHHTDAVHALAFRPGSRPEAPVQCASGGADGTVRIWQPEIGRMVRIIRFHHGAVLALAYAPDGQVLFSAGEEGIVRRLDSDSDQVLAEWKAHDDWIYSLAVSPDGSTLATGCWRGKVKLWDIAARSGLNEQ